MSFYVCSDIHGQYRLYMKMLEQIHFSPEDKLYILGDVVDRGPGSVELLKDLMGRENVSCLLGNHELMMYTHYRFPGRQNSWLIPANGGIRTKQSFETLPQNEQEELLDFIRDFYLQVEIGIDGKQFLLSHSDFLLNESAFKWKDLKYEKVLLCVWNSPWRAYEYVPLEKYRVDHRLHIIGHYPVQFIPENKDRTIAYVDQENHLINLDLGCARMQYEGDHENGKALCCLNLSKYASGQEKDAFLYIW